jgi:hypothetical protein
MAPEELYGVMAEFDSVEAILAAAKQAREAGYRTMDAYTPFPVDGLNEALGKPASRLPGLVLACGLLGAATGYLMQYYLSKFYYPINVGGRPLNSWPAFIPVTFELTILFAAFGAVLGMLISNRLPMPYHPVFNVPEFSRSQRDRFFLCIEKADPHFDFNETPKFVGQLGALSIHEVPI